MKSLTIAAVSFPVGRSRSFDEFLVRVGRVVRQAHQRGAEWVVLPEFAILDGIGHDPASDAHAPVYVAYLQDLARSFGVTIIGGSHIERRDDKLVNTCAVVSSERVTRVDKYVMTQWESAEWGLAPGGPPTVVGGVGVSVCYDSEFPELIRPLAEAGALVLAVPFFTETRHGYQRVRWSGQARAIENQIFVVQAALVGSLGGEPVPSTYGRSAILAPSVNPFPESCVLAETPLNRPGMAVATLDFEMLAEARETGDVRNWNDYLSRVRAASSS